MAKKVIDNNEEFDFSDIVETNNGVDEFDFSDIIEPVKKKEPTIQFGYKTGTEALSSGQKVTSPLAPKEGTTKSALSGIKGTNTPIEKVENKVQSVVKVPEVTMPKETQPFTERITQKVTELNTKLGTEITVEDFLNKQPKQEPISEGEAMGRAFLGGVNELFAASMGVPEYLRKVVTNPILELAGLSEDEKQLFFDYQRNNPQDPLYNFNKIQDFYKSDADLLKAPLKGTYDKSVTDLIDNGDYVGAAKQVGVSIAESLPATLGIAMATYAGLPPTAITPVGGVVFGSQNYQNIAEDTQMTESQKQASTFIKGFSEGLFEQLGTSALTKNALSMIKGLGKEEAVNVLKKQYVTAAREAIKPYFAATAPIQEGVTEAATTLAQNVVDKYFDPSKKDINILDGVADSFVVGGVMGTAFGAAPTIANSVLPKNKARAIELEDEISGINKDLDNPNVPDDIKPILAKERAAKLSEANELIELDADKIEGLPQEKKELVQGIKSEIATIDSTLTNESSELSETSIKALEQNKVQLEEQLETVINETEETQEAPSSETITDTIVSDGSATPTTVESTEEVEPNVSLTNEVNNIESGEDIGVEPTEKVVSETKIKPKSGFVYRVVDNSDDAVGSDKSFSTKTDWYEGEGFLIEAKKASGKDIEHHKGAKRGEIKPEDVTTIYYEPNGVATTPEDVQRELVKMKAKFPKAKFVEVESIEDENGENQLHVVSETVSEIEPPVVEQTTTDVGGVTAPDVSEALKTVESTAKALEGVSNENILSKIKTFSINGLKNFYHASQYKRKGRLRKSNAPQFGTGIYFSSNKDLVKNEFGENVTNTALNLSNPVFTNTPEWNKVTRRAIELADAEYGKSKNLKLLEDESYFKYDPDNLSEIDEIPSNFISDAAQELGYDAIIDEDSSTYENEIVVLDESKIIYDEDIPFFISEAYHKAKADDSNPELVAAVEELLGAKPSESARKSENLAISKAERKKIAEAKVDEIANKAKEFADKYLKSKGIEAKKSGFGDQNKVIDVLADTVKTLVNAGIEIDEAIREVRAYFESEYDTSGIEDYEIKQTIARNELTDYAKEQGFTSYRNAVYAVNKYVRPIGKEDVITKEDIDKAKEAKTQGEEDVNEAETKIPKGEKLRGNYKTVIKYIQNIPDNVNEYLKQNPLSYQPVARKENLQYAKNYIIEQGEANGTPIAYTKFMGNDIGLEATPAQKVSIGYLLRGAFAEQYNEVSELLAEAKTEKEQKELQVILDDLWSKQTSLAAKLANDGTQYGQAVDAYSLFAQTLTDEISALFHFGKLTEKMAEKAKQNNKPTAKNIKDKVSKTVQSGVKNTAKEMSKAAKNYTPKEGKSRAAKKERDAAWNDVKNAFAKYRNMGAIYNPWEEAKKDKEAVKALTNYLKAELKYKSVQLQQVIKQVAELLNIDESFIDAESVQGLIAEAQKGNDAEKVVAMADKEAAKRAINQAKEISSTAQKQERKTEKELEKLAKEIANKPDVLQTTFEQIIEDFYADQLDTQGLVNLIKDRLDVTDTQAKSLASKLETLLKLNVRDKIAKQLDKQIDKAKPKDKKERKKQDVYQTLIRAQMMNVLNENTIQEILNPIFNIPTMTAEDISFVKETMAKYKQTGDPSRKAELLGKMVKRFNDKNPIAMSDVYDSFWYANVLSGFTTTGINITFGLGILEYAYMANFLLNAGKFTKSLVGDGSVKEQLIRSGYNYWRSIFQTGTKTPTQILKPYQNEDTPLYETFNNVMSVMKYGPDVFLQEVKNLDYNKRAEFNLADLSRGKNKLTTLLLTGADVYRKAVPAILNSVDLAYSTTAKNLFLVPVLEDYYKEQGLSGKELTQAIENDIFNTQEEVAAAKQKAKADRKLIDITVEEKDGKWVVTDNAALFGKKKTFDTKEAAEEHVDKISEEGTKFNKGVIDYLNAKIPKPSVDASRRIASRYLLTAEPEGTLGYFYDKYITKWKINAQQAFQETSNPKLKRGFNFALDKMLVFLRVPFNMFNIAIDNSPLGFARYFSNNGILYDYKRAEYTKTERNLVLAHAMMGTAFLAYELFAQDIIKIDDEDDEDKLAAEQKRKQELLELWNKKYPNEPIEIGNPIFELPKDGELFGSLDFLTPNQKKFLISNNLAAEYSRYNAKSNRFESYQASPNFLNFALVSGISNYEKYVINDNTKFTDRASKKKEFGEVAKWATTNMMTSYLNLSGLKSQQQIISMFGSGRPNENNIDKALELATSSIQLNPAIIKQSVANFDGVMRERLKPTEKFLEWTASKFVPIGGAFVKGEKMHDMFGQEMPMVYGSKQGGLLGYYFDVKFKEKELERTKMASYLYLNGYSRYRDFAKELKNKEVVAFENGEYKNKQLMDEKELKKVGVEAAKLANSLILENKDKLDKLTEFRIEEVDYKSPTLKTPFAKGVDAIFSAAFRYKWLEQAYLKGHLSEEAFEIEKENIKYIGTMLNNLDVSGKVLEETPASNLVEFGYLKEE